MKSGRKSASRHIKQSIFIFLFAAAFSWAASCLGDTSPIIIYGDSQSNGEVHKKIAEDIANSGARYVFHVGDLVMDGSIREEWDKFNGISAIYRGQALLYPVIGNHENGSRLYFENFNMPEDRGWYSVDAEGIHFVILDSNMSLAGGSEQYKWLKGDLSRSAGRYDFTIALFHHPIFSSAFYHITPVQNEFRSEAPRLFKKYGVDMVFSGHVHAYERCSYKGIYYITTGGGGGKLRPKKIHSSYSEVFVMSYNFCELFKDSDRITVKVYDENMRLIDDFNVLTKTGDEHE